MKNGLSGAIDCAHCCFMCEKCCLELSRLTIRFREQYYRRFKRTQSGEVGPMRYRRTGKWTVVNPEFGLFFQAQSVFAG